IAEAIEFSTRPASAPAPRYEDPAPASEPPPEITSAPEYQMMGAPVYYDMPGDPVEPRESLWIRALLRVGSIFLFPFRHPIRLLAIALGAYLLSYVVSFVSPNGAAAIRQTADRAVSSVSSFVDEQILRQSKDTAAVPAVPEPKPSPTTSPSPSLTS